MSKSKSDQEMTEEEFLASYSPGDWERPSVTVDALVFTVMNELEDNYRKLAEKTLNILLIKRGNHPCMGQWALPGGFVDMDENLEKAVERELKEETHVENIYLEQLYTWGDVDRDKRSRIISVSYLSLVDSTNLQVLADDDAADAAWFKCQYEEVESVKEETSDGYVRNKVYELTLCNGETTLKGKVLFKVKVVGTVKTVDMSILEAHGIAFDHAKIIAYGIERLRNKIEYTDIAFNMMPGKFTLTALQKVYEIILGKTLLKANFRRKIAPMLTETEEFQSAGGHRPSKLYTYNPDWRNE